MDLIQVLGIKDLREVQCKDENQAGEFLVRNNLVGDVFEENIRDVKNKKRYVRGISKTDIKYFINRKDCPVKNHFIGLPKWIREDSTKE
tara:strand:+ start:3100 stop:3366 length:267 start_codon:yes stop_codon:yes gene_type:complete